MRSCHTRAMLAVLLLAGATGCATYKKSQKADRPVEVEDEAGLIRHMANSGVSLMDQGPVTATRFTSPAHEYQLTSGGVLYVFTYPTGADALAEVAHFEGTRNVDTNLRQIYRKKDLVVIYFGDDPRVERALVRAMGSRIA